MELDFIQEEVPKITRAGGSGREVEPWEHHLAPLKAEDKAGQSFRVWTYDKRPSGTSRMTSVRNRLTKAVPHENWEMAVRPVPGTNPTQYGVYVSYAGVFTPEQIQENARKHQERSARVKAARTKALENGTPEVSDESSESGSPTAKERVAAAREKSKPAA